MEDGVKQVEQNQETDESPKIFGNLGRTKRDALSEASLQQKIKKRRQQRRKLVKNNKKKKAPKKPKKGKKPKSIKTRRRQQQRKRKEKKTKKNQGDKKRRPKLSLKQAAESKPITKECLTNILTTIKLRTKGTNYKKQHDRIIKFEKTGKNKLTKKAQFTSVAEKLIEVGN